MTYTNRATLLMMVMRPNKVRIDTLQTDNPTLSFRQTPLRRRGAVY